MLCFYPACHDCFVKPPNYILHSNLHSDFIFSRTHYICFSLHFSSPSPRSQCIRPFLKWFPHSRTTPHKVLFSIPRTDQFRFPSHSVSQMRLYCNGSLFGFRTDSQITTLDNLKLPEQQTAEPWRTYRKRSKKAAMTTNRKRVTNYNIPETRTTVERHWTSSSHA